jgi:tyrosyl-tRNA synthetase
MTAVATNVLDTLTERGFVNQVSDMEGLRRATERPITLYCGFDPTSDSLHIGHLVQVMALAHFQRHGHRPIALVGGGTTMIGDPTGRATGRSIMTKEEIAANAAKIKEQLSHYLDFSEGKAIMLDNAAWLTKLNYIDFLRDIGRYFSVNQMLAMETYKSRLETGLSFLEFNYLLLQSYDFLHMYREDGCILQIGGGDQWSNCLGGMDLIRKADGGEAFVMTTPLITDASGQKMGKSTGNALSLNPAYMSPYDYYQFWINVEDVQVGRFLGFFTFLPMEEIRRLAGREGADLRAAKETLAYEATKLTHGEEAARTAQAASRALFSGEGALGSVPTTVIPATDLNAGLTVADLFVRAGLATGRGDARRLAAQGGASIDGERIDDMDRALTTADIPPEGLLLRAGKKRYQRIVVEP